MAPEIRAFCRHSLIAALAVTLVVVACHKSAEREEEEAERARAEAAEKEQRAFDQLEHGSAREAARALVESQEAREKAAEESADVTEAIDRERHRYRALLTKELAWLDRRVARIASDAEKSEGAVRAEKEADVAATREWRERLEEDLDAIDHPPEGMGWSAIKARIDRDLDEDRPLSVPRSYEKSYGI